MTISALEEYTYKLEQENAALKHSIDIATKRIESLMAQLHEAQAAPNPVQKSRWYGYKSATRKGAFDMLEVASWEGSQLRVDGPWSYHIYFRYSTRTVVLDETQFKYFADAFDAYLTRT